MKKLLIVPILLHALALTMVQLEEQSNLFGVRYCWGYIWTEHQMARISVPLLAIELSLIWLVTVVLAFWLKFSNTEQLNWTPHLPNDQIETQSQLPEVAEE